RSPSGAALGAVVAGPAPPRARPAPTGPESRRPTAAGSAVVPAGPHVREERGERRPGHHVRPGLRRPAVAQPRRRPEVGDLDTASVAARTRGGLEPSCLREVHTLLLQR